MATSLIYSWYNNNLLNLLKMKKYSIVAALLICGVSFAQRGNYGRESHKENNRSEREYRQEQGRHQENHYEGGRYEERRNECREQVVYHEVRQRPQQVVVYQAPPRPPQEVVVYRDDYPPVPRRSNSGISVSINLGF